MEKNCIFFVLCAILSCTYATSWNNLNCPAPRAPDNGLSFIFRNGEVIHFRCHPGYMMHGTAVTQCVNNTWTHPAPECIPIRNYNHSNHAFGEKSYHNRHRMNQRAHKEKHLFDWGDHTKKHRVYGDGPRRLPLINGIWPPQDHAVLSLGVQSTPGPRTMIKEEVDIAELRHNQLEELKRQRYYNEEFRGKRRRTKNHKKNKQNNSVIYDNSIPRETVLALGSTDDGQILSVAHAKPGGNMNQRRQKPRHRGNRNHHNKKKFVPVHQSNSNFITSRTSRVDTSGISPYHTRYFLNNGNKNDVAELRRRPVEEIQPENLELEPFSTYDASCTDRKYRRSIPKIAPQINHAFVFRYETNENNKYPFNSYMEVKYRCLTGYHFDNPTIQTLFCQSGVWIGNKPECVENTTFG